MEVDEQSKENLTAGGCDYTTQQMEEFLNNTDCEIDDPQLLGEKKHLATRFNPLSALFTIQAKSKYDGFQMDQCWETRDSQCQKSLWHYRIGVPSHGITADACDYSK